MLAAQQSVQEYLGLFSYEDSFGTIRGYELKEDSTFTYLWSDGCQPVLVYGTWTINQDTVILTGSIKKTANIKLLKGIIDTKILKCTDGLYTLVEQDDGSFIKDKKLIRKTKF